MARRRQVGGVDPGRTGPKAETLDVMIAGLADLDVDQIRLQWRNELGGLAPAHLPRWLLARVLAFRMQAAALGDLDKATLRRLRPSTDDSVAPDGARPFERRGPTTRKGVGLKAGALLVREWQGRPESVMILEDGFAWRGGTYRSLSQIARAMTGTSWNGHRFFGLRRARENPPQESRRPVAGAPFDAALSSEPRGVGQGGPPPGRCGVAR
jgi:Protein of unknown function (DUF2924)